MPWLAAASWSREFWPQERLGCPLFGPGCGLWPGLEAPKECWGKDLACAWHAEKALVESLSFSKVKGSQVDGVVKDPSLRPGASLR